ncbi:hypothetical protein [Peterkaempfera sp. SMS 1(5)a]|uniref:hypothetical protein n=1 Tax=Peterkaempfera podocarpi TaxID=3232308 RepID=UPI0036734760
MDATWGIEGWQPRWWRSAAEVVEFEGAWLRGLVGQAIGGAWGVWIVEEDEWFADLPVLLAFGERQIAMCVNQLDLLSVTEAAVDVASCAAWWNEWTLQWRSHAHPAMGEAVGRVVTGVGVTEYDLRLTDASSGRVSSAWVVTGLVLALGDTGLWVFNAADENGLQCGLPPEDRARRTTWLTNSPG